MTVRGPRRSRVRPMQIPATAEMMRPAGNAAAVTPVLQPVSAVMAGLRTGTA